MKFNDNLRNLRLQRKMTQMKLAESIGTSQSAVAAWENQTREPDFRTIQKLADFFNVPLSALLPSDDSISQDYINVVTETFQKNQKLKTLFDLVKNFDDANLNVLISVAESISGKREFNL